MSFVPRMTAEIRAIRPVRPLLWRRWPGVIADLWHVRGEAGGGGYYLSPDPRIVVFLDGPCHGLGLSTGGQVHADVAAFYMPAGVPLWSDLAEARALCHLDLHLDQGPLARRLAGLPAALPAGPRFLAEPGAVLPLARLLAREVERPCRPDAVADGLLTALLAEILDLGRDPGPLPLPLRLKAALCAHIRAHAGRRIAVGELAAIAGQSEGWFSRRFREAEGMTVQAFILRERVAMAADFLTGSDMGLAEIALATGFADQAHMTRALKSALGVTPGRLRRSEFRPKGSSGCGSVQSPPGFPS